MDLLADYMTKLLAYPTEPQPFLEPAPPLTRAEVLQAMRDLPGCDTAELATEFCVTEAEIEAALMGVNG